MSDSEGDFDFVKMTTKNKIQILQDLKDNQIQKLENNDHRSNPNSFLPFVNENRSLLSLNLDHQEYIDSKLLYDILSKNKTLQKLSLQSCRLEDRKAINVANGLKVNRSLLSIDLYENEIGDEGIIAIANSLKSNQTLQKLSIDSNQFGPKGVKEIAEMLKVNKTLKFLDIHSNNLDAQDVKVLVDALIVNESLENLNLSRNNDMGVEGAKHIAYLLNHNKILRSLDISANDFNLEGITDICEAMKSNQAIQYLNLEITSDEDIGFAIHDMLFENKSLKSLDIQGNEMTKNGFQIAMEPLLKHQNLSLLNLKYDEKFIMNDPNLQEKINQALALNENLLRIKASQITKLYMARSDQNEVHHFGHFESLAIPFYEATLQKLGGKYLPKQN